MKDAVFVTGGAGYVGSHTVLALRAAGYPVLVFDNLSTGHRAAVLDAELIVGDLADEAALSQALGRRRFGAVMHFAASAEVGESVARPAAYYHNNLVNTLRLLDVMRGARIERLVFSSTCAVYGEPKQVPITEDHPQEPINAYGDTKLAVERALRHYERAYGLRPVSLRYFNAAGADPDGRLGEDHRPESHVIPRAFQAVLGGAPLRIFGSDYPTPDGTCLRDYVHVTDLADAHLRALRALEEGRAGGCYNLGNGRTHSVREVVAAVERAAGRPVPCEEAPRREGDAAVLLASNVRIERELGWRPRLADLGLIVETAWRWRERNPRGYDDGR